MVKFASIGMFTFQLSLETVTKNDKKPFSICYLSWLIGIISEILCVCVCARLELSNHSQGVDPEVQVWIPPWQLEI